MMLCHDMSLQATFSFYLSATLVTNQFDSLMIGLVMGVHITFVSKLLTTLFASCWSRLLGMVPWTFLPMNGSMTASFCFEGCGEILADTAAKDSFLQLHHQSPEQV